MPQMAGYWKDASGSLDGAFRLSAGLLLAAAAASFTLRSPRPPRPAEAPA